MTFEHVIGAGQLGAGIAEIAAASARQASLHDTAPGAVERGREAMRRSLAKLGFAHPMGSLAVVDRIGLDTCVAIMEVLHEGLGDPKYAPCPLLRQYVATGRLGRTCGRDSYEY